MNMNDIKAAGVGEKVEREKENPTEGLQLRPVPACQTPDPQALDVFVGWPGGVPSLCHHSHTMTPADKLSGQSFGGLLVPTDQRPELGADHEHA